MQIIFSIVGHYSHSPDRVAFYNTYGEPKGNINYVVPHLVYDPLVTLYNPYNDPLTLNRVRVKIWDPPVGFRIKKNGIYLRSEFDSGSFLGLARFQIANEYNLSARKTFTLVLSDYNATTHAPGAPIVLQPGESRAFSAWVESNWTWGLETAAVFDSRSFFEWNASDNFTNWDVRTSNTFGVETIPYSFPESARAGFQTDWLSSSLRPPATRYDFEIARGMSGGWVAIKLTDELTVEAKAMRAIPTSSTPDFQVDLLGGQTVDPTADRVKAFPMTLSAIKQPPTPVIVSRTYRVSDILQTPTDVTSGGKRAIAAITMIAKTKALLRNGFYQTPAELPENLYELQFYEVPDFSQLDGFLMTSDHPAEGLELGSVTKAEDTLFVNFAGKFMGQHTWKVKGTTSLDAGFTDDLTAVSQIVPGPSGTGINKAIINISGRGNRYFVRIEE